MLVHHHGKGQAWWEGLEEYLLCGSRVCMYTWEACVHLWSGCRGMQACGVRPSLLLLLTWTHAKRQTQVLMPMGCIECDKSSSSAVLPNAFPPTTQLVD